MSVEKYKKKLAHLTQQIYDDIKIEALLKKFDHNDQVFSFLKFNHPVSDYIGITDNLFLIDDNYNYTNLNILDLDQAIEILEACKEAETMMQLERFALGKDYIYDYLEKSNESTDLYFKEYGESIIGQNIVVITREDKCSAVFVLTGLSASVGHIMTCVYNDSLQEHFLKKEKSQDVF